MVTDQPDPVIEPPVSESATVETEQDAPYKMGDTFYMDDGKPHVITWIGFHEISYSSPDTPYISKLMEKADFETLLRDNPLNSHFSQQGVWTEITDPTELAEIEAIFGDSRQKPIADLLYEEESLTGDDITAYYLFHIPDGKEQTAELSHETLSLITQKADTYVICADACFLSDSDMERYNIGFRKMPRDWNLLPETVQDQLRAIKPEYEKQWLDSTQHERDFETWQQARETPEPKTAPAANYRITDDHLGEGGAKTKFRNNIKALHTLKDIEFDNRNATPEEQEILSRYVGWGGVQEAFDPDFKAWENEYLDPL